MEFDSRYGDFFLLDTNCRERSMAWVSTILPKSTRLRFIAKMLEAGKCSSIFAIKTKVRTVVGRGEKSLLGDPGSELHLGREKEK